MIYLCDIKTYEPLTFDRSRPLHYETIQDGQGCDELCQVALFDIGIREVERNVVNPQKEYLAQEPGWHIYKISHKGDPHCQLFYDAHYQLHKGRTLNEQQCIALKKNEKPYFDGKNLYDFKSHIIKTGYAPFYYEIAERHTFERSSQIISDKAIDIDIDDSWFQQAFLYIYQIPGGSGDSCEVSRTYIYPELR